MEDTIYRLPISLELYPLAVIEDAIYAMGRQCPVFLSERSGTCVIAILHCTKDYPANVASAQFLLHLSDFALRHRVNTETKAIKETIIRVALSEACPVNGDV